MALNATTLRDLIISTLANETDRSTAFSSICSAIKSHVDANMVIAGTYTGTIPGPSADPLNGAYIWTTNSTVTLVAANLESSVDGLTSQGSAETAFEAAMQTELRKAQVASNDDTAAITLSSASALSSLTFSYDFSSVPGDITTAWGIIATQIVSSLTSVVPASVAATSTAGGTGTVTFTSVT